MTLDNLAFRRQIRPSDIEAIDRIVTSSAFFSRAEIDLALDLAKEKLADGDASSYQFLFGEDDKSVWGYTCFGLIPATAGSYDLYWIAVDDHRRSRGGGRQLIARTEEIIRQSGGEHVYIETSSRPQYLPTQIFYERCGYTKEAFLKDFYAPGDGKVIYSKTVK